MFGARRDGATDDSAAINAALSFGRPVKLTSGTYRIANTIYLPVAGTVLTGPPTTVIAFAPTLPIAMRIQASQCEFRGFKLMSDAAPTQAIVSTKYGIYVGEALYDGPPDTQKAGTNTISARNVVMDLMIENLEIYGIHGAGIRLNYVDRSRVVGNLVRNCGTHGIMISLGSYNEMVLVLFFASYVACHLVHPVHRN